MPRHDVGNTVADWKAASRINKVRLVGHILFPVLLKNADLLPLKSVKSSLDFNQLCNEVVDHMDIACKEVSDKEMFHEVLGTFMILWDQSMRPKVKKEEKRPAIEFSPIELDEF